MNCSTELLSGHTIISQEVEPGAVVHADGQVVGTEAQEGRLHVHCDRRWLVLQHGDMAG